jgi:DNA mismatch repair protein MutL
LADASFGQARPEINEAPPKAFFSNAKFVGELAGRLWICEGQGGTLLVIDPHAVRERVFLHALKRASSTPQRTLFSTTVNLGPTQAKKLAELMPALTALGVEMEPFGSHAFAVKSLPLPCEDVPALLDAL